MPAARELVGRAGVTAGMRVLDVACGTGNVAVAAGERGATVAGVDASAALVEEARRRAAAAGADASFVVGELEALPVADGWADATLSSFGVIFAADGARAAAELVRATRPGGVVALSCWRPSGPVHHAALALRSALPPPPGPPQRWDEPDWIAGLLREAGAAAVEVSERTLRMEAPSPAGWFAEQEEHHPVWRWARRVCPPGRWERVRRESLEALEAGRAADGAFRIDAPWAVLVARRP